jgi:hypothetical protein
MHILNMFHIPQLNQIKTYPLQNQKMHWDYLHILHFSAYSAVNLHIAIIFIFCIFDIYAYSNNAYYVYLNKYDKMYILKIC